MLKHILEQCEQDPTIQEIYLHVQTNNEEAINFYRKFGFHIKATIDGYYKNIDPTDAHVLSKSIHRSAQ